jgi:hypothetical protein
MVTKYCHHLLKPGSLVLSFSLLMTKRSFVSPWPDDGLVLNGHERVPLLPTLLTRAGYIVLYPITVTFVAIVYFSATPINMYFLLFGIIQSNRVSTFPKKVFCDSVLPKHPKKPVVV